MEDAANRRIPAEILFLWVITALAVVLRLADIDLRPLHSDEGVNFHFIQEMFRRGYYNYSHENYHGPAYFYFTGACVWLFGNGELGLRLSAIVSSLISLLFIWRLTPVISKQYAVLAVGLVALTSSSVFHARYAIHESLFLMATVWMACGVFRWFMTRSKEMLWQTGIALGLIIATKETFIIALFCIFFAFLTLDFRQRWLSRLYEERKEVCMGLLLAALVILIFFSGGFVWKGGIRELFLAVPQWIGRNESDTGHFKPFLYYFQLMAGTPYESWLPAGAQQLLSRSSIAGAEWHLGIALILIIPVTISLFFGKLQHQNKGDRLFFRFSLTWALLAFLVYSFVKYKTPWLVINISLPLSLFLAGCLQLLLESRAIVGRFITALVFVLVLSQTVYFNFLRPYGKKPSEYFDYIRYGNENVHAFQTVHPFTYVHTDRGMVDLIHDIERYSEKSRIFNPKILVAVRQYWPLPFYAHNRGWTNISYSGHRKYTAEDRTRYDIIILTPPESPTIAGSIKKYYRLSEVQEANVYFLSASEKSTVKE